MICPECGRDNPVDNRFCGACGKVLPSQPPAEQQVVREPETEETGEARIAGPSFLGLGQSSAAGEENVSYLLEEEPRRRPGAGLLFLLLVLLAVVAVFAYKRHYLHLPQSLLRRSEAQMPATPPAASNAAETSTAVPAANPSASDAKEEPPAPMTQSDRPASAPPLQEPAAENTQANSPTAQEQAKRAAQPTPQQPEKDEAAKPSASPADAGDDTADNEADAVPVVANKPNAARLRGAKEEQRRKQADDPLLVRGENYLYGRGVAKNCDQALVLLKSAANSGNPKAMGHLGAMYATGQCVALDRTAAYRWFTMARAADPGNPWLESNRQMVWREMTAAEQTRAARQ